jgi:hypothetical protein
MPYLKTATFIFIYLFHGLFDTAVSRSDYTASNGSNGYAVEESGHILIWGVILAYVGGTE